jgi:hypothetical protein
MLWKEGQHAQRKPISTKTFRYYHFKTIAMERVRLEKLAQ